MRLSGTWILLLALCALLLLPYFGVRYEFLFGSDAHESQRLLQRPESAEEPVQIQSRPLRSTDDNNAAIDDLLKDYTDGKN